MTPRQGAAWLELTDVRKRADDVRRVQIINIAVNGDKKSIEALIEELEG